eukprot:TRINITY_DN4799_c0_g1_i1.p1 TRINITY_DN4799_c0_g1~~TRINITY_DN4799_c0_g1_i1.p1  ORF type:complete len:198 (-),score=25.49 TRINITY_DN4799_c0_g1_i1:4-573(-)
MATTLKRLFIYTSKRKNSVSSTILDKIITKEDTRFNVWDWDLATKREESIEMKYAFLSNKMNGEQQELYDKIKHHKEWLHTFSEIYVGVAMHNFAINVNFKNYIDILVQPGICFTYVDRKPVGLMKNNPWNFVVAGGGNYLRGDDDYLIPWVKKSFDFCGIDNLKFLAVTGTLSPNFKVDDVEIKFTKL